jgi:osmotically-inducible protein OsmY
VRTNARIEDDVRAALQRDPHVKHPELIAVSVDGIGTVVLRGAVESLRQRRAAKRDARQVDGVFEVIDHLKVHPPIADRGADDEIRAEALQIPMRDTRIWADDVRVEVSHGWVTLTRHVRQRSQRAAAVEDVASLGGVVGVTDDVKIE